MSDIITVNADGRAEIAMELNSGDVLWDKNADEKMPMASTTKIMTAFIICQSDDDLDAIVTVPDEAVGLEGSSVYLKSGEEITMRDLLYGLMLRSGNDAATALAVLHSGSVEKFVAEMNYAAYKLGAKNTHFANPSGLPDRNHYTTARDLCNIARAAMKNELFSDIVSARSYEGKFRSFLNKNKFLRTFDGANGIKTGYTKEAGRCLVSSARRANMDVVCIVLNCYDMYGRSAEIIERCFADYSVERLPADSVFVYDGKLCSPDRDHLFTVPRGKPLSYFIASCDRQNNSDIFAKLEIYCENSLIFDCDLYNILL